MNKDNIFVLTMFEKLTKEEDVYHIGQTHTMGWFPTMEDARYMLENNLGDLCRGKFAYAVIQEDSFISVAFFFCIVNTVVHRTLLILKNYVL